MAFSLAAAGNPFTSETEGTAGATAVSTGFLTAALTDLKSSGTSDTASSTAREISPLEASESTTFFTGVPVRGLNISFLKSGVGGGCGFDAGGGAGVGTAMDGQVTQVVG